MKNVVMLLIFVVIMGYSSSVFGEQTNESVNTVIRRAMVDHEGVPGFWFERQLGLEILADLSELVLRRREIGILHDQLSLRNAQIDRMHQMITLEQEASTQAIDALETAERRTDSIEEAQNKWWRSPLFLFSAGVITTVVIELVAIVLLIYLFPG